jgi:para-nitrobenzyl esterase
MNIVCRGFVLAAALLAGPHVTMAATVITDAGAVRGAREAGLTVYKGVAFAAAPVGDLRWREPQPVRPWKGVRAADVFAPACMQSGVSMPGETPPAVSEDCLYLNIWTPAKTSRARLPVMVWIYGGGFSNGSASMPLYWGDQLARRGVVVVTVAYRVGPFGFLAHPELTRESGRGASGNYGLMDQIAALHWVQRNIAGFGGDPHRVTISGQSAGATSVSLLMASPLAIGLFQRAIGESGGMFEPIELADYPLAKAEAEGQAYAASLGADSVAALRRLPASALLGGKAASIAHPVIEPYVLPASPYAVFKAGRQSDVPILVGSNADEARSLTDLKSVTAATFTADLLKAWGPIVLPVSGGYPHDSDAEARRARADLERDLRFGWDIWAWARLQAGTSKSKVFSYYFTHKPPFPDDSVYAGWGASHFAELWYVFDHLGQERWRWSASDRRLADVMSSYWVNFARSGDPNGPGLPVWPRFDGDTGPVLTLGDPIAGSDVANLKTLRLFDALYRLARAEPVTSAPARALRPPASP